MQGKVVFVDVDDTLVRSVGTKRIPMPAEIANVRRMHSEGAVLYLWSSGGGEYAKATAAELNISECFEGFLPKPHIYVDDQPVHEWRFCKHVYPGGKL